MTAPSVHDEIVAAIDGSQAALSRGSKELRAIIAKAQAVEPPTPLPSEVEWELAFLDLRARPVKVRTNDDVTSRFSSLRGDGDARNLLSNTAAIAYFRQRATSSPSPFRRARYYDVVWSAMRIANDKAHFSVARLAISSLLEAARWLFQQKDDSAAQAILALDCFERAAELAVLLKQTDQQQEVVTSVADVLGALSPSDATRWVIAAAETLELIAVRRRSVIPPDVVQRVAALAETGIVDASKSFMVRARLYRVAGLAGAWAGSPRALWDNSMRLAQAHRDEAKRVEATDGAMAAYPLVQQAAYILRDRIAAAPDESGREAARAAFKAANAELRRILRTPPPDSARVTESTTLPREELEKIVTAILKEPAERRFLCLASLSLLLPNAESLKRDAVEAAEKYVLSRVFPRMQIRDGRKVSESHCDDAPTPQLIDQLEFWFQVHLQLLDYVIGRLIEERAFTQELLLAHFANWELGDNDDSPFVERGLERYFAGDHISALHVLTPRVEHMLKMAFEMVGRPPVVLKETLLREQTFGDFLRADDVKAVLGEDAWTYLYYLLVDERVVNLRNDVAHGWINGPACHRGHVQAAIFAMLVITRIGRTRPSDEVRA